MGISKTLASLLWTLGKKHGFPGDQVSERETGLVPKAELR